MATVTEQDILTALSAITEPDSGKSVVDLGMVDGLVVRQGHVAFSLTVDPAKGAALEPLRKACEDAVYQVKGVLSVTAVLTAHSDTPSPAKPAPQSASAAPRQAAPAAPTPQNIPGIKSIIAVARTLFR